MNFWAVKSGILMWHKKYLLLQKKSLNITWWWKVENNFSCICFHRAFAFSPSLKLLLNFHELFFLHHVFFPCPSEEGELGSSVVMLSCPLVDKLAQKHEQFEQTKSLLVWFWHVCLNFSILNHFYYLLPSGKVVKMWCTIILNILQVEGVIGT